MYTVFPLKVFYATLNIRMQRNVISVTEHDMVVVTRWFEHLNIGQVVFLIKL